MNLYSYCLNTPLNWIDPLGLDIWHIINRDSVGGHGHGGTVVGQDRYYTYNSYGVQGKARPIGPGEYTEMGPFDSLKKAMDYAKSLGYDEYARYRTGKCEDEKAREAARKWDGTCYNMEAHNCQEMVNDMMWAANVPFDGRGHPWQTFKINSWGLPFYDKGKIP